MHRRVAERLPVEDFKQIQEDEQMEMQSQMDHTQYLVNRKKTTMTEAQEDHNFDNLQNHIVVCGIHSSIFHFILPLRAKYLQQFLQDIVIVAPQNLMIDSIWDSIAMFQNVFLLPGSPLDSNVLKKAKIETAAKAVILGFDPTLID